MKKLFSRKGMTLAEVLIAVAILALFVSMAIVGTSGLFGTAEEISVVSKAAVLGSDVMQVITNEIRYGEEFSLNEKKELCFNSSSYGNDCKMYSSNGELVLTKTIITGTDENKKEETTVFKPLGTVAYDEVSIQELKFTVDSNESEKVTTVTVNLSITGNGKVLWSQKVSIVPLVKKLAD